MKKVLLASLTTTLFLYGTSAQATPFGDNITIDDNRSSSSNSWYNGSEDNEVEPDMLRAQQWDMEGMFLDGNLLTVVGGFDQVNGVTNGGYTYRSGDLFIDTDGDAQYGVAGATLRNGYDYVFDLNFTGSTYTYDIFNINNGSTISLLDVIDYNAPESSPWRYESGGTYVGSGNLAYSTYSNDDLGLGFTGTTHYTFTVDLTSLGLGTDFIAHYTMECGNDNLMAAGTTPVPEPATMFLFGTGLASLAGISRRRKIKKA